VGELPLHLQVKLLRFLQEGEVRAVGDTRARKVDVRVLAATARDLRAEAEAGRFREDLLYRLDVVGIRIPPLRERPEDVPALARHFLVRYAPLRPELPGLSISDDALRALAEHRWPGNVRELEHAIERAVVLADGPVIGEDDLPDTVRAAPAAPGASHDLGTLSVKRATRALEEQLIRAALEKTGGNRTRAAELLELSYRALLYKIKDYGIS
jgi:two-component system response regulator AtoC